MNRGQRILLSAIIVVLVSQIAFATDISACNSSITVPDTYTLTANVVSGDSCFIINTDNVTIDCQGFSILYTTAESGIGISASNRDNLTIRNCNIASASNNAPDDAIRLTQVNNSVIENVTAAVNATLITAGADGIQLTTTRNITISDTIVRSQSATGYAIRSTGGTDNTYTSLAANTSAQWAYLDDTGTTSAVNFTLQNANGSVQFNGTTSLTGTNNISGDRFHLNTTRVFFDHSLAADFNRSAQLTLSNITFLNPQLRVDFADNGTLIACNAPQCVQDSYAAPTFVFNVSGFTTYDVSESGISACGNVAQSGVLTQDIIGNNCLTITADNVEVDCRGFTIYYGNAESGTNGIAAIDRNNITVKNCNIHPAVATGGNAILLQKTNNSRVMNTTANTTGPSHDALQVTQGASNNTFSNVTLVSPQNAAVRFTTGSGNILQHSVLAHSTIWVANDQANNLTNVTFLTVNGSIRYNGTLALTTENITQTHLNITNNTAFANSTAVPILNTTAQITFFNNVFPNPDPQADFEDDGTFAPCTAPQCTEVSFAGGTYVFNVASFTTYSTFANVACGNIAASGVLTGNISSNTDCITITADNVELDCRGFSIFYDGDAEGYVGITAANRNNISVKNCRIIDLTAASNNNHAIELNDVQNSTFTNNSLYTSSVTSFGIGGSGMDFNTFTDTFINTTDWILPSGNNNTFTNTTFNNTNGSIQYTGTFDPSGESVLRGYLDIYANRAFANSTNNPPLNASARITLRGLTAANVSVVIDTGDNGTNTPCTDCTLISYNGSEAVFDVTHFTSYLTVEDVDQDGVNDTNDTLIGNASSINTTGTGTLSVTVNGSAPNGTFTDIQTVRILNNGNLVMNFTFNFSAGTLDLRNISIEITANSTVVNVSGMVSNKTLYLADTGFTALCVKDEEIASVSAISTGCNGSNEYNFTGCISGTQTIGQITCTDEGARFRIDNLNHSGVSGSGAAAAAASSGGGGGGGSSVLRAHTMIGDDYVTPQLRPGQRVLFDVNGQQHALTLLTALTDRVSLRIESTPQEYTLLKNGTWEVDANLDGRLDLAISIIDTQYGLATLRMRKLAAAPAPSTAPTTSPTAQENKETAQSAPDTNPTTPPAQGEQPNAQEPPSLAARETSNLPLFIGILLIIAIIIGAIYWMRD
ncbi:hypothetical protein C4580_00150 [Candidatus Woesearchaeota archaeon]|nr:MAG: hypothetical protein C4580_00150 [Candidatus Woesearchaeota archaeon]